jgi:hypothetical protein
VWIRKGVIKTPFFMFCFLLFQGRFCGDHFIIEHTPALLWL